MGRLHKPHGQVIGEYSVTLAIAILAVVSMTIFIQRGFKARLRDAQVYTARTLADEAKLAHYYRMGILAPGEPLPNNPTQIGIPNGYEHRPDVFYAYEPYYRGTSAIIDRQEEEESTTVGSQGFESEKTSTTVIESITEEAPAQDDFWTPPPSEEPIK